MTAVGYRTEHAGQPPLTLTAPYAHFAQARAALIRVSASLQDWAAEAAESLHPIKSFISGPLWNKPMAR
jgi:hypothetical protein